MNSDADFLRSFLAGRDVPCPMCEYNLRDLVGDRCPECGDQLILKVNPVEPKQVAVITGLICLAAGAGLNGLLLIYWVFVLMRRFRIGNNIVDRFFGINAGGFLIEGFAILFWLMYWKQIRRAPPTVRRILVAGCAILTLADLVVFVKYIK